MGLLDEDYKVRSGWRRIRRGAKRIYCKERIENAESRMRQAKDLLVRSVYLRAFKRQPCGQINTGSQAAARNAAAAASAGQFKVRR